MRGTEFAELSAFVAVAENRNFTKAAAHLGTSTPNLSQKVRALEERLGVRLFNRTTRSVALTEAGDQLLTELRPVMDGVTQAVESVNAFRDKPVGVLRLSAARPAATLVLAPLLSPFLSTYPSIRLEIMADDSNTDIVSERFDAGIRIGERIEKDMIAVRLTDELRVVTAASPTYLAQHPRPTVPQDLHVHNCIRMRHDWDGAVHPWTFEKAGQRVDVPVDGSLVLNDMFMARSAARDGIGVVHLPEALVRPLVAEQRLVLLLEDWSLPLSGLFIYYSSRRQVPGPLRAFLDFIRVRGRLAARVESAVV